MLDRSAISLGLEAKRLGLVSRPKFRSRLGSRGKSIGLGGLGLGLYGLVSVLEFGVSLRLGL